MRRIFVLRTEQRLSPVATGKVVATIKEKFLLVGDAVEVIVLASSDQLDEVTDQRRAE